MKTLANNQRGFTIVELMIAAAVFSLILMVITQGLIDVGRIYYKGTISTRTQEVARSTANDIATTIQFAGGTVNTSITTPDGPTGVSGFCAGNQRYSYYVGKELTSTVRRFVSDDISALGGCGLTTKTLSANELDTSVAGSHPGNELLGDRMRLVKFRVTPKTANLYEITIRVAYGDDDTLCSPSGVAGECTADSTSSSLGNDDLVCKTKRQSAQFCSVAEVNTSTFKRLSL